MTAEVQAAHFPKDKIATVVRSFSLPVKWTLLTKSLCRSSPPESGLTPRRTTRSVRFARSFSPSQLTRLLQTST